MLHGTFSATAGTGTFHNAGTKIGRSRAWEHYRWFFLFTLTYILIKCIVWALLRCTFVWPNLIKICYFSLSSESWKMFLPVQLCGELWEIFSSLVTHVSCVIRARNIISHIINTLKHLAVFPLQRFVKAWPAWAIRTQPLWFYWKSQGAFVELHSTGTCLYVNVCMCEWVYNISTHCISANSITHFPVSGLNYICLCVCEQFYSLQFMPWWFINLCNGSKMSKKPHTMQCPITIY